MSRLSLALSILAPCAVVLGAALCPPALAQDAAGPGDDKMNMLIIFGNDPCPASTGGEITVCARKPEGERYRIPAPFRETPSHQDEAWTNRVLAYETVGMAGTQSCSATGAGGWTGCQNQLVHNAYAEKKASSDVQFSRMIDKERQQRLSKIDAQAARTQADVEAAEKDYDARQRATQDNASGDARAQPSNPPTAGVITGSGGK